MPVQKTNQVIPLFHIDDDDNNDKDNNNENDNNNRLNSTGSAE